MFNSLNLGNLRNLVRPVDVLAGHFTPFTQLRRISCTPPETPHFHQVPKLVEGGEGRVWAETRTLPKVTFGPCV